jgi:hypothetical protein
MELLDQAAQGSKARAGIHYLLLTDQHWQLREGGRDGCGMLARKQSWTTLAHWSARAGCSAEFAGLDVGSHIDSRGRQFRVLGSVAADRVHR